MNIPASNDTVANIATHKKLNDKRKITSIARPTVTGELDTSKLETVICEVSDIVVTPVNYTDGQYFKVLNRSGGEVGFNTRVEYLGTVYASPAMLADGETLTVVYDAKQNLFRTTSFLSSSVSPSSNNNSPE
tara:strand:- start:714 stop:1109 length:396 start_codon:yes stop_codon:yes gene_type:complete